MLYPTELRARARELSQISPSRQSLLATWRPAVVLSSWAIIAHDMRRCLLIAVMVVAMGSATRAQQPFAVDDADVTPRREWHVEISNQIDRLRRSALPARGQNTLEWEIDVGLAERVELGVVMPLIAIFREASAAPARISGIGDTSVALKVRATRDPDAAHSFAGTVSLELPTGDRARDLGSGLVDYGLNAISQHRLRERLTLRTNLGLVLAGNTQTGLIGFRERGTVVTGGASLVRQMTRTWQLGAEVTVAWSHKVTVRDSALGWQLGSVLLLRDGVTLDLGVIGGASSASPRLGLQVGTSIDLGHP